VNVRFDSAPIHSSTKHSKQLNYYYRNREQINAKRRTKYKTTINSQINKKNIIEKSNDVFYHKNSSFSSVSKEDNNLKKSFLSFFDILNYAHTNLSPEREDIILIPMKTPYLFVLPEIVQRIVAFPQETFRNLGLYFNDKLSKHQLRHALQLLVNLKWILRRGKGSHFNELTLTNHETVYYPNPFLSIIWKSQQQWVFLLSEYARLKIDFFDLLNVPLIYALRSNQKFIKSEVKFHKYNRTSEWEHAFFQGEVDIEIYAENGDMYHTYLPINFHAASKIIGYDAKTKKRVTDPYGFPHHTLPLSWSLFDVIEGKLYSKKGRESRWAKEVGECEYIHFDNSIKILRYATLAQRILFEKPFEYALKKWNTKSCEYVEVSSFELLEKLFYYRFVENKRREELFDSLGLEHKSVTGRPKKT
jgi:hypothetical protein